MKAKKRTSRTPGFHVAACAALAFTTAFCILSRWFLRTFTVGIAEIIFTINTPLKGTGYIFGSLLSFRSLTQFLAVLVAYILFALACEFIFENVDARVNIAIKKKNKRISLEIYKVIKICVVAFLVFCNVFYVVKDWKALKISEWKKSKEETSTVFEEHYVEPDVSLVTGEGKKLIYIYLESMETAYASKDAGGTQDVNYIPRLTQLAEDNISFTTKRKKGAGGFRAASGTGWTFGALLGTSSGIPFKFPFGGNNLDRFTDDSFTSVVTLGDILTQKGYTNEFLCGSDGDFAGRKQFFEQNGGYRMFDYYLAIEEGYIAPDYHVWWGFEDEILYRIAKDEITRLAKTEKPFNFTMLTVDTHHVGGYVCGSCKNEYPEQLANVLACADSLVGDFVTWIQAQDFYENTVIVISGDHPRMDTIFVDGIPYRERTVYDCFINSAAEVKGSETGRECNTLDMFPTVLAAMGFSIEGERLGLGTNLFSEKKTLSEELGYDELNAELGKYSEFYEKRFY